MNRPVQWLISIRPRLRWLFSGLLVVVMGASGCNLPNFNPKLATSPYPYELHTTNVLPIQVFRDGTHIEIINSTDLSWTDATVWVNQRYSSTLKSLQPGQRVSMDLFSFRDDLGEQFRAGGLFRTRPAAKVELIEIQSAEGMPMVGLISVMPGEGE
ncbi:MAG: hypothetical protein VX527_12845 [Planctomycetota bacterium]|nr:hypothetical protein [Planctomycetota bacterium]